MTEFYPRRAMSLVAWLDAFERIDTLILEIRHIQETIASHISTPPMYEVFEFEDRYIWGRCVDERFLPASRDWSELLSLLDYMPEALSPLVSLWCLEFPALSDRKDDVTERFISFQKFGSLIQWVDEDRILEITTKLIDLRKGRPQNALLSATDDRLYEALRYLQLLKRDLVKDKLLLGGAGRRAFELKQEKTSKTVIENSQRTIYLLLVRRAVLRNVQIRLDAFRDVQSTVLEILNLSLERDPAPTVRRRRDQGIYTTVLTDACRHISKDIAAFFDWINNDEEDSGYIDLKDEIDFLVHRYTTSYTSFARAEGDNLNSAGNIEPHLRAGFILSSFWMPERPDLQPIIAHEVAHLLLTRHYGDLNPLALDRKSDSFARLIRQLSLLMERYTSRFTSFDLSWRSREKFLLECAVDLLSISVQGTAYLFAHFLEQICHGYENLFDAAMANVGVDSNVKLAAEKVTALRDQVPLWHLRLVVSLSYSRALIERDSEISPLEKSLHEGIDDLIKQSMEFLVQNTDGEQRDDLNSWMDLVEIADKLVKRSLLVNDTLSWRKARTASINKWSDRSITPPFRHMQNLNETVSRTCLGIWLDLLVEPPRLLGNVLSHEVNKLPHGEKFGDEIERRFTLLYLAGHHPRATKILFNRLIDIPWQCAMLTCQDFLGTYDAGLHGIPTDQWFAAFHELNWLGRDLYHFALEFVVWYERSPVGRLKAVVRWLDTVHEECEEYEGRDLEMVAKIKGIVSETIMQPKREPYRNDLLDFFQSHWPKKAEYIASHIDCFSPKGICVEYDETTSQKKKYGSVGEQRRKHMLEYMASVIMERVRKDLTEQVRSLLSCDEFDATSMRIQKYLFTLIQACHYLAIRPEIKPTLPFHAERTWNEVFAKYLNVPVHGRRKSGGHPISKLVPARAFKIDRISLEYTPHSSDGSFKGYLAKDVYRDGRELLWYPWQCSKNLSASQDAPKLRDQFLVTSLMGRFDRVVLEEGNRASRFWPKFAGSHVPFFRREQVGFPFACQEKESGTGELVVISEYKQEDNPFPITLIENASHNDKRTFRVPIATINILLSQHSARLTFIERLLGEHLLLKDFYSHIKNKKDRLESPFQYFKPNSDIGLLTDGWGDLFLILFAEIPSLDENSRDNAALFASYKKGCESIAARLEEIIKLRTHIFSDPLVVRSETSYTPVVIDTALLNPMKFAVSMSLRFKPFVDGSALPYRMQEHFTAQMKDHDFLKPLFTLVGMSGRLDYSINTLPVSKAKAEDVYKQVFGHVGDLDRSKRCFGILYEKIRELLLYQGDHKIASLIDSTRTSVSEISFLKSDEDDCKESFKL